MERNEMTEQNGVNGPTPTIAGTEQDRVERHIRPVTEPVAKDWSTGEQPACMLKRPHDDATMKDPQPDEVANRREFVEVPVDSLEASVGYSSLLRQMHRSFLRRVAFYRSSAGGSLSVQDAREAAFHAPEDEEESAELLEKLMLLPLESVDFVDVMELQLNDPFVAEWFWERAKREGRAEFESGHAAANATLPLDAAKELWNVARYLGVRESFAEEWGPRGGVEIALVDMLSQAWFQFQYWTGELSLRAKTEPRRADPEYEEWRAMRSRELNRGSWRKPEGHWDPPYVSEVQAVEHAAQMADRWNRMFMRTLRQMRDLRRYAPVTIERADQVNIAQQQVNLTTR